MTLWPVRVTASKLSRGSCVFAQRAAAAHRLDRSECRVPAGRDTLRYHRMCYAGVRVLPEGSGDVGGDEATAAAVEVFCVALQLLGRGPKSFFVSSNYYAYDEFVAALPTDAVALQVRCGTADSKRWLRFCGWGGKCGIQPERCQHCGPGGPAVAAANSLCRAAAPTAAAAAILPSCLQVCLSPGERGTHVELRVVLEGHGADKATVEEEEGFSRRQEIEATMRELMGDVGAGFWRLLRGALCVVASTVAMATWSDRRRALAGYVRCMSVS